MHSNHTDILKIGWRFQQQFAPVGQWVFLADKNDLFLLFFYALLRPEAMPKSKPHPPNSFIVPSAIAGAVSDKKRHWKEGEYPGLLII
ncbi:hypothetical protein GOBAR_AA23145 [Gossypium barbadense]|uniref:Uncharacterized protein n=1 Tax=Gossypium barbadense TaxID=3634 RepID=A0A2P5X2G8_GOSBA|nr:hypothetical protein GOBAR_AA23145 [Gossypium barbadense]